MCGLEIEVREDGTPGVVRGNKQDVFSKGFLCPKGASIGKLHDDPDRLRTPMVRRADGWHPATWDEAFAVIAERLPPLLEAHGPDALAFYFGNPSVHDHSVPLAATALRRAVGTKYHFSAAPWTSSRSRWRAR
jgi:anaerobic selenocysteine-containing dehydrogenase